MLQLPTYQQDTNRPGPDEEPRRWTRMQEILNELKEGQLDSTDFEGTEMIGLTHESNIEGNNDNSNDDGVESGQTARGKKARQRQSRRLLKRSAKDMHSDSKIPTMINFTEIPPSEVQRTGLKTSKRGSRVSPRVSKTTVNDSISAPTQTTIPRKNPRIKKCTSDVDETLHQNSAGEDDGIAQEEKVCPQNITIFKGEGDVPMYSCNVCRRKFKSKKYLTYHGEFCGTTESKSFICDECGTGFYTKGHLVGHARIHTGEKPFECQHCQQRFTRKGNLQTHIRCHTKEKPFQCPKCPMRFAQKGALQRHIRCHTGEKPFQCPRCPSRFNQQGDLSRHIRCHAKENPYICKTCNLTFVSPQSLHEHNSAHEGKLPFSCHHCDKRFSHVFKLKNHAIIHTDERPFECSKCGCGVFFTQMELLLSHLENVHGQPRRMGQKVAYDAAVAYLLKEGKNESVRDIPARKINAAVVNHVIKKANIQIPSAQ